MYRKVTKENSKGLSLLDIPQFSLGLTAGTDHTRAGEELDIPPFSLWLTAMLAR